MKLPNPCRRAGCVRTATHIPRLNIVTMPQVPEPWFMPINLPLCREHALSYKPTEEQARKMFEQIQAALEPKPYKLHHMYWTTIKIDSEAFRNFLNHLEHNRPTPAKENAGEQGR